MRPVPFIISLDFELHWGVRDHTPVEGYRASLLGVRRAVPALLELFRSRDISATWATVGLLFCDGVEEAKALIGDRWPKYQKGSLDPQSELPHIGTSEEADPFHFAPSLIQRIASTPGQEIATHTFSHFYCLEPGPTREDFVQELELVRSLSETKIGRRPKTIVFPRNQVSDVHLAACAERGLVAYRGTQAGWIHEPRSVEAETTFRRGLRLVDTYIPLPATLGQAAGSVRHPSGMINLPASAFLRPFSPKLHRLDRLRLRRLEDAMDQCIRLEKPFHLWWHPHNFGKYLGENLAFLDRVLDLFESRRRLALMTSMTMEEAASPNAREQAA